MAPADPIPGQQPGGDSLQFGNLQQEPLEDVPDSCSEEGLDEPDHD